MPGFQVFCLNNDLDTGKMTWHLFIITNNYILLCCTIIHATFLVKLKKCLTFLLFAIIIMKCQK